jgi:hypothetical protein
MQMESFCNRKYIARFVAWYGSVRYIVRVRSTQILFSNFFQLAFAYVWIIRSYLFIDTENISMQTLSYHAWVLYSSLPTAFYYCYCYSDTTTTTNTTTATTTTVLLLLTLQLPLTLELFQSIQHSLIKSKCTATNLHTHLNSTSAFVC